MWPSRSYRAVQKVPPLGPPIAAGKNIFTCKTFLQHEGYDDILPASQALPTGVRRLAVKDNIVTRDQPTTCASGILKDHQSPFEATVVKQLRQGRAQIVGKTNLDEFGMGSHSTNSFFGPVLSPAYQGVPHGTHSVGGSSGGSAVAVASGQANLALGTDTGGSVRLPAAYNGIVGYKPSYGLISRWGVVPYANSLDTVGLLSFTTHNLLNVFKRLSQHDPRDPTSLSMSSRERILLQRRAHSKRFRVKPAEYFTKFTIGIPLEYNIDELDPGVRQAWTNSLELLQQKGCRIVPVSLPNTKHALSAYYVLAPAEAASNLSKYDGVRYGTRGNSSDGSGDVLYSKTRGDGFGEEVKRRILLGSYTLSSKAIDNYFIKAQKVRRLVQRDFDRVFAMPNFLRPVEQFDLSDMDDSIMLDNKLGPSQVDFILCPTAPTTAPSLSELKQQSTVDTYMNDVFTVPASLAGLPAISIPCRVPEAFTKFNRPSFAGLQIIGQYSDDFRVIAIAEELEKLLYPKGRRAPTRTSSFQDKKKQLNIRTYLKDGKYIRKCWTVKGERPVRRWLTDSEATKDIFGTFDEWEDLHPDDLKSNENAPQGRP